MATVTLVADWTQYGTVTGNVTLFPPTGAPITTPIVSNAVSIAVPANTGAGILIYLVAFTDMTVNGQITAGLPSTGVSIASTAQTVDLLSTISPSPIPVARGTSGAGPTPAMQPYYKPRTGIPAADLTTAAQDALTAAVTAYQKPVTGVPSTDLAVSAQASLGKADSAVQPAGMTAAIDGLINGAPGTRDTLKEISDILTADEGALAALTGVVASKVNLVQAAKNPDLLVTGAITLDGNDLVTSAAVVWPDGSPGTMTITARDANGAVLAYNITYGSPVTKTFTQPTITRTANGAATTVPPIVVS